VERESQGGKLANPGSSGRMVTKPACVSVRVSCQLAACIMNTTDELATCLSKGDVAVLQTSDLGLFGITHVHTGTKFEQWLG